MNRKIPPEAFHFYMSLGPSRSYEAVAEEFECSRRGVADCAKRERWQERLAEVEGRAYERSEAQALESIAAMNERHMKIARYLQSKGLESLQSCRLEQMDRATRTLMSGINLERLVRGEPTERVDNVEALIRREADRWLIRDGQREASKASAHEPAGDATDERAPEGLDASDYSEGEFAEHERVAEPTDATG